MSYNVKVNDQQVETIKQALDLYTRILIGQFDSIYWAQVKHNPSQIVDPDEAVLCLNDAKMMLFKRLSATASYSIEANEVPKDARIAYNILQSISKAQQIGTSVDNPNDYLDDVDQCLVTKG